MITVKSLNPYFIGLSILMIAKNIEGYWKRKSQSLFYWIIYSYSMSPTEKRTRLESQSLFYWIIYSYMIRK